MQVYLKHDTALDVWTIYSLASGDIQARIRSLDTALWYCDTQGWLLVPSV